MKRMLGFAADAVKAAKVKPSDAARIRLAQFI